MGKVNVNHLFGRLQFALDKSNLKPFNLKCKQVQCFESLLNNEDVIAVLPTGYGKSLLFQLLPFFLPLRTSRNIVIVVSPLNSIIVDQVKDLQSRNLSVGVLLPQNIEKITKLFTDEKLKAKSQTSSSSSNISQVVRSGDIDFLYGHPEAVLSPEGRELLKSKVYQENVVACVIDEAHCVELW